jgi:hypothetical protein
LEFPKTILEDGSIIFISDSIEVVSNLVLDYPIGLRGYFKDISNIKVYKLHSESEAFYLYINKYDGCDVDIYLAYEEYNTKYFMFCTDIKHYAIYINGGFMGLSDAFNNKLIHPVHLARHIVFYVVVSKDNNSIIEI